MINDQTTLARPDLTPPVLNRFSKRMKLLFIGFAALSIAAIVMI